MASIRRIWFAVAIGVSSIAFGAGCGGGSAVGPQPIATRGTATSVQTTFAIVIPAAHKSATARKRAFVSPSTKSLVISMSQNNISEPRITETVGSPPCVQAADGTLTCTYSISVPIGAQRFVVQAFDASNQLLSDGTATQAIVLDAANALTITLNGDVAGVSFQAPAVPACAATTAPISISANDADGNPITGKYSTPITLVATGPAPRGTATPNASVSPTSYTTSSTTSGTLTFDGKSPGATTITAMVGPTVVGKYAFAPVAKVCSEYAITTMSSQPRGITAGSDGNVHFTEFGTHKIASIVSTNTTGAVPVGTIVETPLVTTAVSGAGMPSPNQIVSGPDGNLWVTDDFNGVVKIVTATPAQQTFYPDPKAQPVGIVTGFDSNLWFVEETANRVRNISTGGSFGVSYGPPTAGSAPFGIAAGPDGNYWITESMNNAVAKVTPAGAFTEYPLPTANAQPTFIVAGTDGALWFSETGASQVGRIAVDGAIAEFALAPNSAPEGIVAALDGNVYVLEDGTSAVAILNATGLVREFATPTATSNPFAITIGPDNHLWFTETTANNVGYVGY